MSSRQVRAHGWTTGHLTSGEDWKRNEKRPNPKLTAAGRWPDSRGCIKDLLTAVRQFAELISSPVSCRCISRNPLAALGFGCLTMAVVLCSGLEPELDSKSS